MRGDVEKLRLETNASIDALRREIKANIQTAKNDIVRWIVTMNFATVAMLAGLVVAVIRLI